MRHLTGEPDQGGYAPSGSFGGPAGDMVKHTGAAAGFRVRISQFTSIYVGATARNTAVGGAESGAGNFIADNQVYGATEPGGAGVHVAGGAAIGATVRGNVILCRGPAIVLETTSQPAPTITQVLPGPAITVQGVLNSAASTSYAVDFYSNGVPVGAASVTTTPAGVASFKATLNIPNRGDQFIAATATNLKTGDTSAFGPALPVGGASISGQVRMDDYLAAHDGAIGSPGWPGVAVTLRQAAAVVSSTSTNGPVDRMLGGYYQFCHLLPGTYTVSTARSDLFILPDSHAITLGASNVINMDFLGASR